MVELIKGNRGAGFDKRVEGRSVRCSDDSYEAIDLCQLVPDDAINVGVFDDTAVASYTLVRLGHDIPNALALEHWRLQEEPVRLWIGEGSFSHQRRFSYHGVVLRIGHELGVQYPQKADSNVIHSLGRVAYLLRQ